LPVLLCPVPSLEAVTWPLVSTGPKSWTLRARAVASDVSASAGSAVPKARTSVTAETTQVRAVLFRRRLPFTKPP
jgi:hypothetical protein